MIESQSYYVMECKSIFSICINKKVVHRTSIVSFVLLPVAAVLFVLVGWLIYGAPTGKLDAGQTKSQKFLEITQMHHF